MKAGRTTATIRPAAFDDYPQIASLEGRFGLEPKTCEEWSHLWLGNPLFQEIRPDWNIGWVVEDENRRIVASVGNIPLAYEFQGKRILAASGRALVAEPEYRSAALLLLDRLIHQPGIDLYLNNTIGPQSAASFSGFGCSRVPVGVWDKAAFWIARYRDFFERLLAGLDYPLARPLSLPLSAAASFRDALARRKLRPGDVEVQGCSEFDERFEGFWEDLKRDHPHLLLADRSRRALNWHFRYAAGRNRVYVAAVPDGPRLAAYAILDRRDSPRFGLRRLRLVDFQSRDGSSALLGPVLAWALGKCADEGIHVVEVTGRWLEQGELASTIPYTRALSTWTYFYRANRQELETRLQDRSTWVPSLLDGDASL